MRDKLSYIVYRTLAGLTGRLPPRIGYWLAALFGRLIYWLLPNVRRVVTHNIRHVLGPQASQAQVQSLVRQACENLARSHYELFHLQRLTLPQIQALVRIEGMEHADQALRSGRGAIVITTHLGNLDVAGQIPMAYGIPMTAVVWRTRPEQLFQYVKAQRARLGLRFIASDEPMTGLFRALKRGELICLACDRDFTGNGREVTLFGAPTRLPDGHIRLAHRTGAPVIPAYVVRLPDNSFVVKVEPPLALPMSGDREADIEAGMKLVLQFIERAVSSHPEQWLLASPVWPME